MRLLLPLIFILAPAAAFALDAGFPLPAEYEKRVADGIERYRKSGVVLRVLDAKGKPVKGAKVEVRQIGHDFLFGCAFPSWDISQKQPNPETWAKFEEHFLKLFNYATTENMLKWPSLEATEGRMNWAPADALVAWAGEHGVTLKGHCLIWGLESEKWTGYPKWLEGRTPEQVGEKAGAHIREVMVRYKGKIDIWDVVNEPLHCHWFESHWSPDYVAQSLKWAREANPKATLIVNEYGGFWGEDKKFVPLCERLIRGGAPLGAIGEQAHDPPLIPRPKHVFDLLDHLAGVGKDIHLTEITMPANGAKIKGDFVQGTWTPETQGKYYRYLFTLAFSHPRVKAITLWAMWDGSSWLGEGGIISRDWTPKPAYRELDSLINKEWRTNLSGSTEKDGTFRFRGFHGKYEIRATAGGKTITRRVHLKAGGPRNLGVQFPMGTRPAK